MERCVVELRDDRRVTLRPARLSDASGLRELDRAVIADGRGVVLAPDELRGALAVQGRIDRVVGLGDFWLVAVEDQRVVAYVDVLRIPVRALRHNAELSMAVHPAFQGVGLGRILLEQALTWCRHKEIERLELACLANNQRALGLYRSEGFEVVELRRGFMRTEDGQSIDDVRMVWRPGSGEAA